MNTLQTLLLLVTSISITSSGLKIEPLEELEGLRFEEIGKLKLITSYVKLTFDVDIKSIDTLIFNQTRNLDIIKEFYGKDEKSNENRLNEIDRLRTNLALRKLELQDVLYGLIAPPERNENRRKKRGFTFFDSLSTEDGRKIEMDLNLLKNTINKMIDAHGGLKGHVINATELLNDTIDELGRRAQISTALSVNDEVDRKVNAIIKMLSKERLSGDIITISEFYENIKNITGMLDTNEELPYRKMAEYYYNLRVSHQVFGTTLKLEMDIPFVEKTPRTLYKIMEFPARFGDKLILTDVVWKYVAINSNESMMLESLDPCYKSSNSVFYCETQSPLQSISKSDDCVTKALMSNTIDVELCKIDTVKSSFLTFIRLSDGQYFYYTPTNETLNVTCKAKTTIEFLNASSSGILELDPECRVLTSGYKLLKSVKYQQSPYKKQNILCVSFDVEEVLKNIKKFNTTIVDNFYVDSLSKIREMSKAIPDPPEKIKDLQFIASFGNFEILQYLLMIVLAIFIIHVVYKTYMWCLQRLKCLNSPRKDECKKTFCDV
ncbi:unnamed protein product [Chironomus riparius]|uniref:Envelope protein n=1 Tax=Chironomus riparius TaxID=315576 RepID=A0A9N9S5H0_9DIPT|nr:unnamed protein product [Chironomus riparius]